MTDNIEVIFGWLFLIFAISLFACLQVQRRRFVERALSDAQILLQNRESKLKTILENAPIVFSAIDAQGIFSISEGKGLQKLGRENNQSVGTSIFDMHNQNPIMLDAVQRALSGEQVTTAFVLRGIPFELYLAPETNRAGQVTGASMLSVDISERRKVEEEKAQLQIREQAAVETSKLKSEFLATMSHEIRTPMNGVLGMTALLLNTPLNNDQKEFAQSIKHSGDALLAIINDILDFSKIEAGKVDLENIPFDLTDMIYHILKNLSLVAVAKGVDLRSNIAPDLPSWVHGDPGRIRQILNNLIGNAVKFTAAGSVIVHAKCLRREADHTTFGFEIEDTGIGISKAGLDRMFIPFSQAEASMARRFGGTGLGLSITKQLVEKMGGQIGVRSEGGKGSTFWFNLTLKHSAAPTEASRSDLATATARTIDGKSPLVLIVEDNQINQIITRRMLDKMGCQSHLAVNGLEALTALTGTDYDLVLMDCQMPEMDGIEATRIFRARAAERNRGIPILAITANAMKDDEQKCLAAGMDAYLSKPISLQALSTMVLRWMKLGAERRRAS